MSTIHDDHNLLLPQLPEEIIIFHILTKLPTKSLLRFSSVSKLWNSSTSHPLFLALRHRHRHRRPNSLSHIIILISSSSTSHHLLSIPISSALRRDPSPPTLLLSYPLPHPLSAKPVNGLVLLHFPNHLYSDRPDIPAIILNPRTREVFPLPNNNDYDDDETRKKVKVLYNFGYDIVDGVYKVLQIWRFIDVNLEMSPSSDMSLGFKVLSLGCHCDEDEWRWIKPNLPLVCSSYNALFSSSCVSNGGIHWIVHRKNFVLAFDFHHEQFRLIPFPQPFNNNNNKVDIEEEYLVEVGTSLGLLLKTLNINKMEMWLLKDYHNQIWDKEQSFQYDMSDSKNGCRLHPLGTVTNEDGEQILLFKPIGKNMDHQLGPEMLCYDMKRQRFDGAEIADLSQWVSSNHVIDYSFDVYEENIMSLSSILGC